MQGVKVITCGRGKMGSNYESTIFDRFDLFEKASRSEQGVQTASVVHGKKQLGRDTMG